MFCPLKENKSELVLICLGAVSIYLVAILSMMIVTDTVVEVN